ncbi:MAG: SAP domain-containing protein [Kiritimatiellae bacterium]|jgi:hypothetical protein|nr:SAP domain-containing protein [Kiritimatiellia bacterium]
MKLSKVIENIGTITELKRVASAYVIDYRGLSEIELKAALKKTGPQYYFRDNVESSLKELYLNDNRDLRIIYSIMLKSVLMQKDDFMCEKRETEDDIIAYEQSIINRSNEDLMKKTPERSDDLELFKFVLETAWEHNQSISPDEKNLIEKIRSRLRITTTEYQLIEAKLGKFPQQGNELHTRATIEEIRRTMQSKGLIFAVRNDDNTDYDVIPEEIAETIRSIFGMEIRQHGYRALITSKYVKSKKYILNMLAKCDISPGRASTLDDLQEIVLEQMKPSELLGGVSPRDGLDISDLRKWCGDLDINVSGLKVELISRIIEYYDALLSRVEDIGDERAIWYEHFENFACRDLDFLRQQQLIQKDLECERKFEDATNYLFETMLYHKPLQLIGTAHPDGALSFQDKVIFWDNKSKESPVNLQDHIKQFDNYIQESEKTVACFLVIGPEFTADSSLLAMQYQVKNQVTISLITANELKDISESWRKNTAGKQEDPFPLGYLIQPGRFNASLVPIP